MSTKSEISYAGSPLQNTMANMVMPPLEKAFGGAMQGNQNQNLWNIPQYNVPNAPQTGPYDVNNYSVEGWKPGGGNIPSSLINNSSNPWWAQMMGNAPSGSAVNQNELAQQQQLAQGGGGKGSGGINTPGGSNAPVGYNVPGISNLMPNKGWYENLDPNIQQSMMEPTNVAAREMLNVMGGQGQMSARGGYSGEAQTALADLYSKGAQQSGMNAWNMISPIQQGQWGAQLGANQYGAQTQNEFLANTIAAQNQQSRDVWGAQTAATQGAWSQNNMANMAQWQAQLGQNQWGAQNQLSQNTYPYTTAPSMWGGSVPNPVVSPTIAGNIGGSALPMILYGATQLAGKGG